MCERGCVCVWVWVSRYSSETYHCAYACCVCFQDVLDLMRFSRGGFSAELFLLVLLLCVFCYKNIM